MPDGMLARTVKPAERNGELVDGLADVELSGEGRGVNAGAKPRRRRRSLPGGKVSGRKFQLPDSVFERLALHALKNKTNASAVVAMILDRELPKHTIATEK